MQQTYGNPLAGVAAIGLLDWALGTGITAGAYFGLKKFFSKKDDASKQENTPAMRNRFIVPPCVVVAPQLANHQFLLATGVASFGNAATPFISTFKMDPTYVGAGAEECTVDTGDGNIANNDITNAIVTFNDTGDVVNGGIMTIFDTMTQQWIIIVHGIATLIRQNGETVSGTWYYGELVEGKQSSAVLKNQISNTENSTNLEPEQVDVNSNTQQNNADNTGLQRVEPYHRHISSSAQGGGNFSSPQNDTVSSNSQDFVFWNQGVDNNAPIVQPPFDVTTVEHIVFQNPTDNLVMAPSRVRVALSWSDGRTYTGYVLQYRTMVPDQGSFSNGQHYVTMMVFDGEGGFTDVDGRLSSGVWTSGQYQAPAALSNNTNLEPGQDVSVNSNTRRNDDNGRESSPQWGIYRYHTTNTSRSSQGGGNFSSPHNDTVSSDSQDVSLPSPNMVNSIAQIEVPPFEITTAVDIAFQTLDAVMTMTPNRIWVTVRLSNERVYIGQVLQYRMLVPVPGQSSLSDELRSVTMMVFDGMGTFMDGGNNTVTRGSWSNGIYSGPISQANNSSNIPQNEGVVQSDTLGAQRKVLASILKELPKKKSVYKEKNQKGNGKNITHRIASRDLYYAQNVRAVGLDLITGDPIIVAARVSFYHPVTGQLMVAAENVQTDEFGIIKEGSIANDVYFYDQRNPGNILRRVEGVRIGSDASIISDATRVAFYDNGRDIAREAWGVQMNENGTPVQGTFAERVLFYCPEIWQHAMRIIEHASITSIGNIVENTLARRVSFYEPPNTDVLRAVSGVRLEADGNIVENALAQNVTFYDSFTTHILRIVEGVRVHTNGYIVTGSAASRVLPHDAFSGTSEGGNISYNVPVDDNGFTLTNAISPTPNNSGAPNFSDSNSDIHSGNG